jgi:acyl dehydratase
MESQMTTAQYTVGMTLPLHTLRAHNDAAASANKIHDDTVAAQYGFRGGLVPGVTVYAYMTYPLVQSFGEAWLARGTAQIRFARPFYEGDQVTVRGTIRAISAAGIDLDIRGVNAADVDCGLGTAALPAHAGWAPAPDDIPVGPTAQPRIPVSWEAVVVGAPLGTLTLTVHQAENQEYCQSHGDDLAVYQGAHGCVHPGLLLRQCNRIFSEHFVLGPWIHVASEVTTYRPCRVGEALEVRGVPVDKFEKKGHEFVVLDVCLLANGTVAQRVRHTCIFRPRKG